MVSSRAKHLAGFVSVILLISSLSAFAQTTPGTVKGVVVDKEGSPLPGATVTLENKSIGVVGLGGVTNAQGEFRITPVPPGKNYDLTVMMPGHQQIKFTLEVYAGKTVVQNVTLREAVTERVKVEGKADVVDTASTQISTHISAEFISGLPVLGTDYQDVLTLAPGVTDVNETGNPNIHGARDTDVVTLVDGVSTTDPFDGKFGQNLNTESIEEIEVITSGAGAQYSRAQGGFVNIVTKSGGNEFKGTFTFAMRTNRLDGDGAGIDQTELRGGLGELNGSRDLKFTDLYPYLSLSGAIVKDHLWYIVSPEYIQEEVPINSGTQSFVQRLTDVRVNAKLTWQVSASNKLALSTIFDNQELNNQGLNSRIDIESGFMFQRGGPTITLQDTAIFSPTFSLESTISRFDQTFKRLPTTDPDTNGNGLLTVDGHPELGGNGDGFVQLRESLDAGEDLDRDGKFDVFEDFIKGDGKLNCNEKPDPITGELVCPEDLDHDGRLTGPFGCEGPNREDINCNGVLDQEFDTDQNGIVDPSEDKGILCTNPAICAVGSDGRLYELDSAGNLTRGNGKLDTEDKNGNFDIDDTPYPNWNDANHNGKPDRGEFTAPEAADEGYVLDFNSNRITGPYFRTYSDSRTRDSLREDMSYYIDDLFGSHDLRMGMSFEREGYEATNDLRPFWQIQTSSLANAAGEIGGIVAAFLPTAQSATNSANSDNIGIYFNDTFKPIPNLTLGLGIRFDREQVGSNGYTYFEPAVERGQYDSLLNIGGQEGGLVNKDLNNDGIKTLGLSDRDPLYAGNGVIPLNPNRVNTLSTDLSFAAGGRLTRHNVVSDIHSDFISNSDILVYGHPRTPEDITITNNNLAPRISVSWDPWADGKSKATATWGRFYDKLFLQTVIGEEGPDIQATYYRFDVDGVDRNGKPDNFVGSPISTAPASASQVNRDLRTPYTDEFTIGFSREIAPEMSVSINYIQRKFQDQLQDIDANHSARKPGVGGAICAKPYTVSGYCDEFGRTIAFPVNGSGGEAGKGRSEERAADGYPDLYIENLNFNQIFRVGNYNVQAYNGIELQFVRRLSRKWQMDASYVFSKAKGQADSFNSESGDDPALTELRAGYLEFDQRHVAKFNATAFLPGDWRVGGTLTWASGLPFSMVNRFTASDNVDFAQTRRVYGYRDPNSGAFYDEDRNSHRNPAAYRVDVRTEKNFVMGKVTSSAFFEIFNLLNTDDIRVFEIDNRFTSLQAVETRRFGRRFQFGISMTF
jgi:outer membrane receptor protein involved in Fe transport